MSAKGRKTKESLLNSLYQQLIGKRYREIGPRSVTKAAGVAHGTFYQYFEDLEDAVTQLYYSTDPAPEWLATLAAMIRRGIL